MLNEEIKEVISLINEKRKNGFNSEEITNLIRKKSIELGLTYQELYNLLFNKDYLTEQVNDYNSAVNIRIEELSKEIEELKVCKRQLSGLICEIYGHKFTNCKDSNIQTCEICGKQEFLPDIYKKLSLDVRKK